MTKSLVTKKVEEIRENLESVYARNCIGVVREGKLYSTKSGQLSVSRYSERHNQSMWDVVRREKGIRSTG